MKIVIETKDLSDVTLGEIGKGLASAPGKALRGLAWMLNKGACALEKATAPALQKQASDSSVSGN